MKKEIYNLKIKEFEEKYPDLDPKGRGGVPVPILIQEAENLFHWCQQDMAALKKAGLDWELVKDIPQRVRFVQDFEAQWFIARKTRNQVRKDYLEIMKQSRALCAELIRDLKFALGEKADNYEFLSEFKKYRKNDEVPLDLISLAKIGQKHAPLLKNIGFDLVTLDTALALGKELADKSGKDFANMDKVKLQSLYKKACFYLKDAVSEVRRCGKYVFHGNKERLIGYRSEYRRLHKGKKSG